MAHLSKKLKKWIVFSIVTTFVVVFSLVLMFLFIQSPTLLLENPLRLFWITFAFISGFLMIGSGSVYPLAIHISTIDNENQKAKSFSKVLAFAVMTLIVLSFCGLILPTLSTSSFFDKFDFSKVIPRLYLVLGLLVYTISLSRMNVLPLLDTAIAKNFKKIMSGMGPVLGIAAFTFVSFFSEVVPGTWLLFMESGLGQNIKYGFILFVSHAFGRIVFVFTMQILATFGINSSAWLSERKNSFKNWLSVTSVIFSSIIISVGLVRLLDVSNESEYLLFNLARSGWLLLILLVVPLWVKFFVEEERVHGTCKKDLSIIRTKVAEIEDETHKLQVLNRDGSRTILSYIEKLKKKVSELDLISKILESSLRHGCKTSIRSNEDQKEEEWILKRRLMDTILITVLAITIISIFTL